MEGTLFGVDLWTIGKLALALLIIMHLFDAYFDTGWRFVPLALILGAEAILIGHQVITGIYCLKCISFAVLVVGLFLFAWLTENDNDTEALLGALILIGYSVILFGLNVTMGGSCGEVIYP